MDRAGRVRRRPRRRHLPPDVPRRPDADPAVGRVPLLRHPRRRHRCRMGLRRDARARPGTVLRPRRLRHGHAPDAGAGRPGRAAELHGAVRRSDVAAVDLAAVRAPLVERGAGAADPDAAGWGVRLAGVLAPGPRALLRAAQPGDGAGLHADHGRPAEDVRRHQRAHRLPDRVRPQQVRPGDQQVPVLRRRRRAARRVPRRPPHRQEPLRAPARRGARPRGPGAVPRLQPGGRQDVRLRRRRRHGRARRGRSPRRSSASSPRTSSARCRRS